VTVLYFAPRGEGQKRRGSMPLGLFLFFFWWSLAPDFRSAKKILADNVRSFSVSSRQNFHKRWRRKSLATEWHKNPFDENKNKNKKMLTTFESHRFDVVIFATRLTR